MKKILYVEDEKDTAQVCKTILEGCKYQVDLAYTGAEGLEKILHNKYDLILLDIMLPDMSGWDIFERIKTLKKRIAFLSAVTITSSRFAELKKQGILDYINKPFTKIELTERIKKLVK